MLRTLQTNYLLPKLIGSTSTNDGVDVTASIGALLGVFGRPGAGLNQLVLSTNFHREPVTVYSPGSTATLGGFASINITPNVAIIRSITSNASGVAEDNTIHMITLGFMSNSTDYVPKQAVHTVYDRPRAMGLKITGGASPTVAIGAMDATVALTGAAAGDYTITFKRPFNRVPVVVACLSGNSGGVKIGTVTRSTVQILCGDISGVAAHRNVHLFVLGSDSLVEQHDLRRNIKVPHRKPEIIPIYVEVTSGVPSISIGSDYGIITDNGVGDYTLTLTKARARTLIPIFSSYYRLHTNAEDTDSVQILVTSAGGSAQDSSFQGFILAYDDANEYYQG